MPRPVNRLTHRTVTTVKTPGAHADGAGLYLVVDEAGNKRWSFVYFWEKRRREMGLGPVALVGLAEARDARDAARRQVRDGVDPIRAREEDRKRTSGPTFGEVAREFLDTIQPDLENPKHFKQWERSLLVLAADLCPKPVALIDTDDVLGVLRPIWAKTPETASRTRARIERTLSAAKANNLRSGENPARWEDHLEHLLTAERERGSFEALPYAEAPGFMARLRARDGVSARALEWTALCVARENMTLHLRRQELDLAANVWTVPAERMKGKKGKRKPFDIPVTPAMRAALDRLWPDGLPEDPEALIFPSPHPRRRGKPMTDAAMDRMIESLAPGVTVHGLRSTFTDWVADETDHPREVREAALAHTLKDKVEAAYRRGNAFKKRRRLAEDWAAFLGSGS